MIEATVTNEHLCRIQGCRHLAQTEIPRDWLKEDAPRLRVCLYHYAAIALMSIKRSIIKVGDAD